jgi:hypothetical protein
VTVTNLITHGKIKITNYMLTYGEKMFANFLQDNWSQFVQIFVYMCAPGTQSTHEPQQCCTLFSGYYKDKKFLIIVHLFCISVLNAAELKRLKLQIGNKEEFGKNQPVKSQ